MERLVVRGVSRARAVRRGFGIIVEDLWCVSTSAGGIVTDAGVFVSARLYLEDGAVVEMDVEAPAQMMVFVAIPVIVLELGEIRGGFGLDNA